MNEQQLRILVENLHLISKRLVLVQLKPDILGTQGGQEIALINKDLLEITGVLIDHLIEQTEKQKEES